MFLYFQKIAVPIFLYQFGIIEKLDFIISQFGNSGYDALCDGITGVIMHKPNGDIPRDPVTFDTILNYRTDLLSLILYCKNISHLLL